jgi:thiamine biosynthesis lipoprotein
MRLDLGAIAKGYAADEGLRVLRQHGTPRALINTGGGVVVGDPPPGDAGWRVGLLPLEPTGPQQFIVLANSSASTSGDAFQFVEINGTRYSHIVNPQTGLGMTERSSVTVVAPDGTTSDSLATAVCVLGPERGLKLIESTANVSALVAVVRDNRPITFRSSRFPALQSPAPASGDKAGRE